MVKYIFVTGGVLSSLGKGVASASIGTLLEARGYRITLQKFDPYLNVDPGTLTPYQHGEVFVTRDGAETDLDLGHYERFTTLTLGKINNTTAGQVYHDVIEKERRGDFLGRTIQVVPHITDEIKRRIKKAHQGKVEIVITEIGGTVGDIESLPFLEAIRQFRQDVNPEDTCCIHLTYVPYIHAAAELKTKPTQHSVERLREIGIQPDIIICRTERPISAEAREKISLYCNVRSEAVVEALDTSCIYSIPLVFHQERLDTVILRRLRMRLRPSRLVKWEKLVNIMQQPKAEVEIAMVGKYVRLQDSYKSLDESLHHAGLPNRVCVKIRKVDSEVLEKEEDLAKHLKGVSGILVPGGFGVRGVEGMIFAIRYARENRIPCFGICLGLQIAVVEFARNVCGWKNAHSTEFNPQTAHPVIALLPSQKDLKNLGGTMRLGGYPCVLAAKSISRRAYGKNRINERHRHRFEVNPEFLPEIRKKGLLTAGLSPDRRLVEIVELKDHPFFVATQFHPEFQSRLSSPHPLLTAFISACLKYKEAGGN
ncbi:MAG: CTP synthase [Candidatus Ratteibacteria bacterium]|jgi:CTP synthase